MKRKRADSKAMKALTRLKSKLRGEQVELARIYVPPYVRVNEYGDVENVDGYWREIDWTNPSDVSAFRSGTVKVDLDVATPQAEEPGTYAFQASSIALADEHISGSSLKDKWVKNYDSKGRASYTFNGGAYDGFYVSWTEDKDGNGAWEVNAGDGPIESYGNALRAVQKAENEYTSRPERDIEADREHTREWIAETHAKAKAFSEAHAMDPKRIYDDSGMSQRSVVWDPKTGNVELFDGQTSQGSVGKVATYEEFGVQAYKVLLEKPAIDQLGDDASQPSPISRPVHQIARDIAKAWTRDGKPVNYAAQPYLDAMRSLESIDDNYGFDSGRSVVAYFLANASTFRGPEARELKKELKALLDGKPYDPPSIPETADDATRTAERMQVAQTIREQLGKHFLMKYGARELVALEGDGGLMFQFGSGKPVKKMVVRYDRGMDLYDIEVGHLQGRLVPEWVQDYESQGIYADQLTTALDIGAGRTEHRNDIVAAEGQDASMGSDLGPKAFALQSKLLKKKGSYSVGERTDQGRILNVSQTKRGPVYDVIDAEGKRHNLLEADLTFEFPTHDWRRASKMFESKKEAETEAKRLHDEMGYDTRVGEYLAGIDAYPVEIWEGPPGTSTKAVPSTGDDLTAGPRLNKVKMRSAHSKALLAGNKAAKDADTGPPSVIVERAHPLGDLIGTPDAENPVVKTWDGGDGPVGHAWVEVRPGNSAVANWLRKQFEWTSPYGFNDRKSPTRGPAISNKRPGDVSVHNNAGSSWYNGGIQIWPPHEMPGLTPQQMQSMARMQAWAKAYAEEMRRLLKEMGFGDVDIRTRSQID